MKRTTSNFYDSVGNLTTVISGQAASDAYKKLFTVVYDYDPLNRRIGTTEATGWHARRYSAGVASRTASLCVRYRRLTRFPGGNSMDLARARTGRRY